MSTSKKQQNENVRLIRLKELQSKTGLGASSIYAMMQKGTFPKAINISERRVAWIESDIDLWISERIKSHKGTIATMEA